MTSLTYAQAGVNIAAGNETVRRIGSHAKRTHTAGVMEGLGGFGALFRPDLTGLREPLLVSATDGVGTKLKVAFALGQHRTVGVDLVAMCANDVLCTGARPLFFLDYFATGQLAPEVAEEVVAGIADGCLQAGCALIGGETAELPGFYAAGEYDLAGFCVGMVEREKVIDGAQIQAGDVVLGLPSSGLHSNGYSLARKVLEPLGYQTHSDELGCSYGEALLEPTRIYVRPVLELLETVPVKALAHITGGGFYENIPRVIPAGHQIVIERGSWNVPPIFTMLQKAGNVSEREMFTTFNMGIGMSMIVAADHANVVLNALKDEGVCRIGQIQASESAVSAAEVVLR